ncbi:MAG TPA: lysophospholipid acyltransferase family protein [bacterium]|nr:lysophospholipid acyltransferase family protein [bacterium]
MSEMAMPGTRSVRRYLGAVGANLWYLFWKTFVWVIGKLAFRLRIEGREHEPPQGPFIVAANHASALDPPLVGTSLHHRASYMGKQELFTVPILGPLLRSIGVFPVRRGEADHRAIRTSLDVLMSGGVLVMFPEGTRSADGRLQKPEPGAALIALRTGVPVLPMAVIGSYRILPKGTRWPRFQQITIRMGSPLTVPRVDGRLNRQMLEDWGQHIIEAIERLLPPEQHRPPVP